MHIVIALAITSNILSILMLFVGLFYNFEQPKVKAIFGYSITGSILAYLFTLSIVMIYGLITNHILCSLILFLCIISPFVIGKLVKYETLKKYTAIQIICFFVSLAILLLKL
jgi:hypothetical protein